MTDASNVNLFVAFLAGVASFVSPCVLPLIPSYLTFITGFSLEELSDDEEATQAKSKRWFALSHTIFFVLGFSIVFVLLGAGATGVGQLLKSHQTAISKVGGLFVVFFGLFITEWLNENTVKRLAIFIGGFLIGAAIFFGASALPESAALSLDDLLYTLRLDFFVDYDSWRNFCLQSALLLGVLLGLEASGVFRVSTLLRDIRFNMANKPSGYLGTALIGVTFAFGWTPCVGPILAAILVLAQSEESVGRGMVLLGAYSMGLGIPFLISAAAFSGFMNAFKRFRRHIHRVTVASGVLMMMLGAMLATGSFNWLVGKLNALLPFLQPTI